MLRNPEVEQEASVEHEVAGGDAGPSPLDLFAAEPYRHVLDAGSGPKPREKDPAIPRESVQVQQTSMRPSYVSDTPIVGIDAEWVEKETGKNRILSYQYAVITPTGAWRGIVYCRDDRRMKFGDLIGHALELGIRAKHLLKWPNQVIVTAHFSNAEMAAMADFQTIK